MSCWVCGEAADHSFRLSNEHQLGHGWQERLDEQIALWHDGAGAAVKLHEFLGLSWEQYACWVRTGHPTERET